MDNTRPRIHLTVAAIIENEGKFLLVEEQDKTIESGHAVLNQPAGHVEPDESIIDAVIRETLEETARRFVPQMATGIYRWQHPNGHHYVRHCFYGQVGQPDATRELDDGIIDTVWLTLEEIRQQQARHRSPLVLRCIEDYLSGQHFPLTVYHDVCG